MLGFRNWLLESPLKQKRKKKNGEQSNNQGSGESGDIDHKGEANRYDQEIPEPVVYFFTEYRL
jgi:hypothetical protein